MLVALLFCLFTEFMIKNHKNFYAKNALQTFTKYCILILIIFNSRAFSVLMCGEGEQNTMKKTNKRKIGFLAVLAVVLVGAIGLAACGIAPTTRNSGYTESGTSVVFDFSVTVSNHANYRAVRQVWENASVEGNALATNIARANLPTRPNDSGLSLTSLDIPARAVPVQARRFFTGGVNMFGEVDFNPTNENHITNHLTIGQSFYVSNAVNIPTLDNVNTVAQVAAWMGVPTSLITGTTTATQLFGHVQDRWDMEESTLTGQDRADALLNRRRQMLVAINQFIVPADLRALNYEIIFTDAALRNDFTRFPVSFSSAIIGGVSITTSVRVVFDDGWTWTWATRHLRFTLTENHRVYFAQATVNSTDVERISYVSWNADVTSVTTDSVLILANEHGALRPMIRVVTRTELEAGDMQNQTYESMYIDGQLRRITFTSGVLNDTILFIIDRP